MFEDIYDNGTQKYTSATDIYDAVQTMAYGEEIGIISEMFADVSWDNQDYYYADNGGKLADGAYDYISRGVDLCGKCSNDLVDWLSRSAEED